MTYNLTQIELGDESYKRTRQYDNVTLNSRVNSRANRSKIYDHSAYCIVFTIRVLLALGVIFYNYLLILLIIKHKDILL